MYLDKSVTSKKMYIDENTNIIGVGRVRILGVGARLRILGDQGGGGGAGDRLRSPLPPYQKQNWFSVLLNILFFLLGVITLKVL